jgi:hypothetical protein
MKSLVLLRIHRDALDGVAAAMRQGRSVADCILAMETADVAP